MSNATVLAVKTHALGDLLLVTPALHRLRGAPGDRRILVVTTRACAPLLRGNPDVDEVIPLRGLTLTSAVRAVASVRRATPRAAAVFQMSQPAICLARQSGAAIVLSLRDLGQAWPPPFDRYTADAYMDLAGLVAPTSTIPDHYPRLFVTLEEREHARGLTGPGPFGVLAVGGGRNVRQAVGAKQWSPPRWAALSGLVASAGLSVVLVGAASDRGAAAQVAMHARVPVVNLAGSTDLRMLASVIAEAALVVSIDSVALHMAVALDCPLVGLFGPTSRHNFLPPGRDHHAGVSSPVPCSPCYGNGLFPGCRIGRPVCMDAISVDEVFCAVRRVLG